VNGGDTMSEKLKFFDLVAKKPFETDQYEIVEKETKRGITKIAIAVSPFTGKKVARIIGNIKKQK